MKNLKINLFLTFLFALTIGLTSCGGSNDKPKEATEHHHDGDEHMDMDEHTFACPMHSDITGKEGDKCTKCGMDLKMVEGDDHKDHNH